MVRMTIRPLAAHCRKYSTKKKVSKISIPCVGCENSLVSIHQPHLMPTWSSITMSVSRRRLHATFSLCFSDSVRSATRVCFTCFRPRSSIRASICKHCICYTKSLIIFSYPALVIPASCKSAWLPHKRLEQQGLPDAHVRGEAHILLYKSHPISKPGWLNTSKILKIIPTVHH